MLKIPHKFSDFAGSLLGERYYQMLISYELRRGREHEPILVWQMGKVGSSTVLASLKQAVHKAPAFHVHLLSDTLLKKGELYKRSIKEGNRAYLYNICLRRTLDASLSSGQKWKIISLVRDPVGRNLSSFFQNLDLYYPEMTKHNLNGEDHSVEVLVNSFLRTFDHDRPLEWFDCEIRDLLGLDVYAEEFPKAAGFKIYKKEHFDLLLLRMEDLDRVAQEAFSEFFELSDFQLIRKNVGSEKKYADIYRDVKNQIILPSEYLDRCYHSKYGRHFYADEELGGFRTKWLKDG